MNKNHLFHYKRITLHISDAYLPITSDHKPQIICRKHFSINIIFPKPHVAIYRTQRSSHNTKQVQHSFCTKQPLLIDHMDIPCKFPFLNCLERKLLCYNQYIPCIYLTLCVTVYVSTKKYCFKIICRSSNFKF